MMLEILNDINIGPMAESIVLSLKLSVVTSVLLFIISAPIAYVMVFNKFKGKVLFETFFILPLVLPPTVLGFFVLIALGNNSPFGKLFEKLFSTQLVFTFSSIVIASILYSFPFMLKPLENAFRNIDKDLLDSAHTMGLNFKERFFKIMMPASKAGIITGFVLSFAHTMGEFGVVLMVGGSISGETKVASIQIYEHVETMEYLEAGILSALMLVMSFLILAVVSLYNRRADMVVVNY